MTLEAAADTTWTGFSLAERDRRWGACAGTPPRPGWTACGSRCVWTRTTFTYRSSRCAATRSDCRYLTLMENAAIVLPTDGRDADRR